MPRCGPVRTASGCTGRARRRDWPRRTLAATGGGMVVHVDDVDAHFAKVKAAPGATILSSPTDQPYGQREYGVRDPDGHSWWFATPTAAPALALPG